MFAAHIARHFNASRITIVPAIYLWNGTTLIETDSVANMQSNSFQCK
jgi:hypothetical protein